MPEGIVKFDHYELLEVAFKRIAGFEGDDNISLTIQSQDNVDDPMKKRTILRISMTGSIEATVVLAGIFSLTDEFQEQCQPNDLLIIATSILLPYARSILSFISASDGSPPVLLPTVNLNKMFGDACSEQ